MPSDRPSKYSARRGGLITATQSTLLRHRPLLFRCNAQRGGLVIATWKFRNAGSRDAMPSAGGLVTATDKTVGGSHDVRTQGQALPHVRVRPTGPDGRHGCRS